MILKWGVNIFQYLFHIFIAHFQGYICIELYQSPSPTTIPIRQVSECFISSSSKKLKNESTARIIKRQPHMCLYNKFFYTTTLIICISLIVLITHGNHQKCIKFCSFSVLVTHETVLVTFFILF